MDFMQVYTLSLIGFLIFIIIFSVLILNRVKRSKEKKKKFAENIHCQMTIKPVAQPTQIQSPIKEKQMDINVRGDSLRTTLLVTINNAEDLGRFENLLAVTKAGVDIEVQATPFTPLHVAKYLSDNTWAVIEPGNDKDNWSVLTTEQFVSSLENKTSQL